MDPGSGLKCDPAFLGPLDGEFLPDTGAHRCFTGEEKYLSRRKLDAREKLVAAIQPSLERVLDSDETVLYIVPVIHNPRFLEVFGLGVWYVLFFRAALVMTDRRVVEIMLRKPDRADTQICSYSWGQVGQLKLKFGTLALKPVKGRTQKWKLQERGDRKVIKLLVPHIQQQLLPGDVHNPRPVPLWHCPECGAATPKRPDLCGQCGTRFKSRGLAAALSLAFPGAGLAYAGHPVLAALDFVGESLLFFIVAISFLFAAGSQEVAAAVILGAIFFVFTKLESAHLSSMFAQRTRPDPNRVKWRRGAVVGAVLSLVLMVVPPVFTGALGGLVNVVDRDLDFAANELGWSGGHDPDGWAFGYDDNQRSEWIRDDGQGLFVWSLPLGPGESESLFVSNVTAEFGGDAVDSTTIGGFKGIRVVENDVDENGEPLTWVRWMLFDSENQDIHILGASTSNSELESLEAEVDQLVRSSGWIAVDD